MSKAELTRAIAAPLRTVASSIDRVDAREGEPTITWNKTRTVARDVSDEGIIEIRLQRIDAKNTSVTIEVSTEDPLMSLMLQMGGTQALGEVLDEIEAEALGLGGGDLGL